MKKANIASSLRERVKLRAKNSCEYCQIPAEASLVSLQIDHIIPENQGGPTEFKNLALACRSCNTYKGYHIVRYYYDSGKTVFLFNPRKEIWSDHFRLTKSGIIASVTDTGKVTVELLRLNEKIRVEGRLHLINNELMEVHEEE